MCVCVVRDGEKEKRDGERRKIECTHYLYYRMLLLHGEFKADNADDEMTQH